MIDRLSPIVIFAYNRKNELQKTINNLLSNQLSSDSDLFIFSDSEKTPKDYENVKNVRNYIKSINGFKSMTVIERNHNYGLAKNIIEGVTEVINKYGKIIVLEDDLLTSKNFLVFMNQALDYYEPDNNIFTISGYTGNLPSISSLENDVYSSYRPSSWGWATWSNQWKNIDWNVSDFEEFINNKKEVKKFNRGGIDMARMLRHYKEGKNNSWAIRWSYAMYKQNKYAIYPKISKVQNIGFGENATHCTGINIYQAALDETFDFDFDFTNNITPHSKIVKEFKYQYSYTNKLIKKITTLISNET